MIRRPPRSTLFPYTPLFRSRSDKPAGVARYRMSELAADVLDLIRHTGHGRRRATVVGHDWGGVIAWHVDRKSTRLNSSHANISYAVFCLKKKQDMTMNSKKS